MFTGNNTYMIEARKDFVRPPEKVKQYRRDDDKVGRNELCPCNSGKKFKKCCTNKVRIDD